MKRVFAALCILLLLSGCTPQNRRTLFAMDTYVDMTVYGGDTDAAEAEIRRLDALLSVTSTDSDIARHNRGEGVSAETVKLIERADEIREMTGGAFDIAVQSVVDLWNIKNATDVPNDADIKAALADKSRVGLGAVAKGYAASRVREILEDSGVKSAVLSLGGNVMLVGSDIDGSAWNVGIQHPLDAERLIASVSVSDTAVVTSGGYQRYFEKDGVRYHHIIDPATGYPADSGILSATVITKDDTLADALSTAVYVMGVEKAAKLYQTQDVELIMVTDSTVYVTEGLEGVFTLEDSGFMIEVIEK